MGAPLGLVWRAALLLAAAGCVAAQWKPGDRLPGEARSCRRRRPRTAARAPGRAEAAAAAFLPCILPGCPPRSCADFTVPTLDGILRVGGAGAADERSSRAARAPAPAAGGSGLLQQRWPLLVVCYDAGYPSSRAMWREPASLDALLQGTPAEAELLVLPHNGAPAACLLGALPSLAALRPTSGSCLLLLYLLVASECIRDPSCCLSEASV